MTNTLTLERLEELENRNKVLENKIDTIYENNHCLNWLQYKDIVKPLQDELDNNKNLIRAIKNFNVKVGDGITLCYYSDRKAYTIIRRTAKTITIQRDKAILNPNFKPEFIQGGFAGTCINQNEQEYIYERDENGRTLTLRWSDKYGKFVCKEANVRNGRHEFYDYNF